MDTRKYVKASYLGARLGSLRGRAINNDATVKLSWGNTGEEFY